MEVRFSRTEILYINNLLKNSHTQVNKRIAVPTEETFAYVLNKAKAGNEMAAVQIDEWHRFARPSNNLEKYIFSQISKATNEILK